MFPIHGNKMDVAFNEWNRVNKVPLILATYCKHILQIRKTGLPFYPPIPMSYFFAQFLSCSWDRKLAETGSHVS